MNLPDIPQSQSKYMKWLQGENRLRVLAEPISGFGYWVDNKPIRVKSNSELSGKEEDVKYFWALPVYNYAYNEIQVLEITQKTILTELKALNGDKDWGDLTKYDIVVTRSGEGMETKYSVMPKPAKDLAKEAAQKWADVKKVLDLNKLFDNGDPFESDNPNAKVEDDAF